MPEAQSIHFHTPTKEDWEPHPQDMNTFRLCGSIYWDFKNDFDHVTKQLKDCCKDFQQTHLFNYGSVSKETVAPKDLARLRLVNGFYQLTGNSIKSWQDFVVAW
jgi:hypothetical protein